jgi:hypothetical protein
MRSAYRYFKLFSAAVNAAHKVLLIVVLVCSIGQSEPECLGHGTIEVPVKKLRA